MRTRTCWHEYTRLMRSSPPICKGPLTKHGHGYSRDHRGDCVQVVVALVVTPEGLPLAYEVLPGNTADNTTLRDFLARIERQYGKARRIWLWTGGSRPRRCWPRCEGPIPRSNTSSARPRAA